MGRGGISPGGAVLTVTVEAGVRPEPRGAGGGQGGCAGSRSQKELMPRTRFQVPTDAYRPIKTNLTEERRNFQNPEVVLNYLQNMSLSLPDKPLSQDTARNLTKVKPSRARALGCCQATVDRYALFDLQRQRKLGALT